MTERMRCYFLGRRQKGEKEKKETWWNRNVYIFLVISREAQVNKVSTAGFRADETSPILSTTEAVYSFEGNIYFM
jgi:hypothetical protein